MPVPTKKGRATRQRLLEAAVTELVAGNGDMEVERVAARAGGSVGLIYRYFGSKAGLLTAVVQDFYDRCDAEVMGINPVPGADWGTREHERTARYVRFFYMDPLAPIFLTVLSRDPQVAASEAQRIAEQVAAAARNLALGQRRGEIPADLDTGMAGAMVIGGLRQAMTEALARDTRPDPESLTDELWRFIVAAVRFRRIDVSAGSRELE